MPLKNVALQYAVDVRKKRALCERHWTPSSRTRFPENELADVIRELSSPLANAAENNRVNGIFGSFWLQAWADVKDVEPLRG